MLLERQYAMAKRKPNGLRLLQVLIMISIHQQELGLDSPTILGGAQPNSTLLDSLWS